MERVIESLIGDLEKSRMRNMVIDEKRRIDGRKTDEIRPITCELGVLPRAPVE